MKSLLHILNNKYTYVLNKSERTLRVGDLITLRFTKGRGRSVFIGILLKYRKRHHFITLILRNSYKKYTFEKNLLLTSTAVKEIRFIKKVKNFQTRRKNLFFIRKLKRTYSTY